MSGRGKLTLCSWIATMLAACALIPLVTSEGWLLQAAFAAALVSGVGALTRRVPLARTVTVVLQAAVAVLLLTALFAHGHALLGFLPTPDAIHAFGTLFHSGSTDVTSYSTPAPATPGIRLMLVGGVVVVGLAVDAIAVTFRNAAPAGLPLLALYAVAAGISGGTGGSDSWVWFTLAAIGYLVLLLAEGGDRLSQWGRVFGGGARGRAGSSTASHNAFAPARTGRRIGVVALGIAIVVPLAVPSLDGSGLLAGVGGGNGAGVGGGGTISAVNPLVSLQDDLNNNDDRQALRYRTNAPDTSGMYLRIMALDEFDGTTWRFSQRRVQDVPDTLPTPQGLDGDVSTSQVTTKINAAPWYRQNYLPMPYPATHVDVSGHWRFEPAGRTLVGDRGQTTQSAQYTVSSLVVNPTRQQLATAPPAPKALQNEYTEVPSNVPAIVKQTAVRVTKGATNNYEKAVDLQDYFALDGGFTYNTHVDSGTGPGAIARFLKDKEGFCIHFSFAMAAMARTLGIPARVAVGFTPGTPESDGTMSVSLRDAHAWPELYFQGVGWTRFEPTPSRGSIPDYTLPQTPTDTDSDGQAQLPQKNQTEPSTAPSTSTNCAPQDRHLGDCGTAAGGSVQPPSDRGLPLADQLLIGIGSLALLLLLLSPLLWRTRVRSRRTGAGAHLAPSDPAAAWNARRILAAWHELVDTAWDHGIPPDDSLTPRRAAERIVRLGRLDAACAESVHRIASAVEQALYAPEPGQVPGLSDDVRRARAGLRASVSRTTRLRAVVAPRSSVRLLWAASERWESLAARWSPRRLLPSGGGPWPWPRKQP
jgi:transglutaminase-like putative cysteine protease